MLKAIKRWFGKSKQETPCTILEEALKLARTKSSLQVLIAVSQPYHTLDVKRLLVQKAQEAQLPDIHPATERAFSRTRYVTINEVIYQIKYIADLTVEEKVNPFIFYY